MILVTEDLFQQILDGFPSEDEGPDNGFDLLNGSVCDWAKHISNATPVAYVEAEFFGGIGGQHAIVWDKGLVTLGPLAGVTGPINKALMLLGASATGFHDEFEAIGLNRGRGDEDWIKISSN